MKFRGLPVGWGTVSHISDKTGYIASTGISSIDNGDVRRLRIPIRTLPVAAPPYLLRSLPVAPLHVGVVGHLFNKTTMPGPGLEYGADHYTVEDAIQYASLTINSNYVLCTAHFFRTALAP
jgi:hypothetical protein